MIPQYTAAALVNECKVLSHPACTDSIPTSLGQEDHVSMGAESVLKCWQIVDNVEIVLAIELLTAAQALDFRMPLRAGRGPQAAHDAVRRRIPHADADRPFGDDIAAAIQLVRSGEITAAAESAVGHLT
jgi:histidine ammonia-lyase